MALYEFPRQAVASLVEQLAGVAAVWSDMKYPQLGTDGGPRAWVKMTVTGHDAVGQDDLRTEPDPLNADARVMHVFGYRLVQVAMRCESMDAAYQAYQVLEHVRWGLRTTTAGVVYAAEQLAIVRTGRILVFRGGLDSRVLLAANMDVTFGCRGGGRVEDDPGLTIGEINSGGQVPFTPTT